MDDSSLVDGTVEGVVTLVHFCSFGFGDLGSPKAIRELVRMPDVSLTAPLRAS